MDLKTIVDKIKTFLSEQVEVKLMEVKTTDGLILNFETLEVGVEVFIIDENGSTPAPDGTYTFEDGTSISIVEGKIETITIPEEPVEGEPETETEPEEEMKSPDTELVARIEALEKENLEIKEMLTKIAENLEKINFKQELKKEIEPKQVELSKTPKFLENTKNTNNQLNTIFKNMYK